MSGPEKQQLFYLLDNLGRFVNDEDELGSIVGYTLIDGLNHFKKDSARHSKIKYDQVRCVYDSFNTTIAECRNEESSSVLFKLQDCLDPRIEHYLGGFSEEIESDLLKKIIHAFNIKGGTFQDRIRRYGLDLKKKLENVGESYGKTNILLSDYRSISDCFIREKGDRRW